MITNGNYSTIKRGSVGGLKSYRFSNQAYTDWFLPSKDELHAMQTELCAYGLGNFNLNIGEDDYNSSSEIDTFTNWAEGMSTGLQLYGGSKGDHFIHTRAVRSFTSAITYNLRDIGPAGGLIFAIVGNTYYEAAPADQADEVYSNIINVAIGVLAQGTAIGTGQSNTTAIIGQAGHTGSAAKVCDDLSVTNINHICCIYKNKWLKFDGAGVLSLSLDNGLSFPITLDLAGVCNIITYSRILANGTIGFASQNHFYYSHDNLATYHESTVIARNGAAFSSSQRDIFKTSVHDRDVIVGGKQIVMWGSYSIDDTENNVWKTIDSFHTIKSVFRCYTDYPQYTLRHVEFINCDLTNNVFWMRCGDTFGTPLFKATYNWETDTITWETVDIPQANNISPQYSSGFGFYGTNFFWAEDGGDNGIWKCPYADIANSATWTELINMLTAAGSFHANENGIMIATGYGDYRMYMSYDKGATAELKTLTGGPSLGSSPNIGFCFAAIGPDDNNWFRLEIFQGSGNEEGYLSATGIVLLMQIIPTAGSN